MMNMNELNWGYRPFRCIDTLAVYGARAIFQNGRIEFLHDRQQFLGSGTARVALREWINSKALPALKKHIREKGWTTATEDIFSFEDWAFAMDASPHRSYGYIYVAAYLKGLETFPEIDEIHRWSGNFKPEIGETVLARINGIGPCCVLGYYVEHGWIGVIAKPAQPPEWFIRQNGEEAICGLMGTEIRALKAKE